MSLHLSPVVIGVEFPEDAWPFFLLPMVLILIKNVLTEHCPDFL
jgi:hypothetical protein